MAETLKHIFDQYQYDQKAAFEVLPGQWLGMDTAKRWLAAGADCEPISATRMADRVEYNHRTYKYDVVETVTQQVIVLTVGDWVSQLTTLPEPAIAARRKDARVVIDADTAYAITQHCKKGDGRQFLGVSSGGSVYYTNNHYLLRQGPPDPTIYRAKCLDFGGKRVKKGQGVAAEYTSLTMPACERAIPKAVNLLPGATVDCKEIDRLYAWFKAQGSKRFNTLTRGGLYTNFESGDAHFDIVLQSSYNLEYLKAVSDWVGPGALWAENKENQGGMVVTSSTGHRIGVVMPLRD